jgi:hypothetical protein
MMKVCELIEHLKTINPDLPVMFTIFDDGYHYYPLSKEDVAESEYEDWSDGKDKLACIIGEQYCV